MNEQGEAVGYILCAPDYDVYLSAFKRVEKKKMLKLNLFKGVYAHSETLMQKPYAKVLPAHLHIDILKPYQKWGSAQHR